MATASEGWDSLPWEEEKVQFLRERLQVLKDRFPDHAEAFRASVESLSMISRHLLELTSAHPTPNNPVMLRTVLEKTHGYLIETEALCDNWEPRVKLSMNKIVELLMLTAKFKTLGDMLGKANSVPASDLFSIPHSDKRWLKLKESVKIVAPRDPEELERGIRKMSEGLIFGNAVVGRGFECADARSKELVIGAGTVLYRLSKKKTRTQALLNYSNPSRESILALWNMLDSVLMAPLIERGLTDISLTKVIHIPRFGDPVLPLDRRSVGAHSSEPTFAEEAAK